MEPTHTLPRRTRSAPRIEAGVAAGLSCSQEEPAAEPFGRVDASLLERSAHDPEAFAELYRRTRGGVERYLRRRIGPGALLDDLVAETYLELLRRVGRLRDRGEAALRAYLYRLATTRLHRWLRHRDRRFLELPACPVQEDDAAARAREEVRRALLFLPPDQQTVLALHHLEELPIAEIAVVLRCRPGTVKSRLHRARQELRRHLERGEGGS